MAVGVLLKKTSALGVTFPGRYLSGPERSFQKLKEILSGISKIL